MAKGRPPLNPRIEALEKHISNLDQQLLELKAVLMQHDRVPDEIFKIAAINAGFCCSIQAPIRSLAWTALMGRQSIVFKGAWTPEKVRKRIRVGVLLTRLKNHALGKLEHQPDSNHGR